MERFSIEVTPRRSAAGSHAKSPAAATPCDLVNCEGCAPASVSKGVSMHKANRNPAIGRPQDLSPLSDD